MCTHMYAHASQIIVSKAALWRDEARDDARDDAWVLSHVGMCVYFYTCIARMLTVYKM
jgi:hypothetical protein